MIRKTFRCPECSSTVTIWTTADAEPPTCPECSKAREWQPQPFGVLGDNYRASKVAEQSARAQAGEGRVASLDVSAADRKSIDGMIQHIREDISEHRATAPAAPHPNTGHVELTPRTWGSASAATSAYKASNGGLSPVAKHLAEVNAGRAFDARSLVGRRHA